MTQKELAYVEDAIGHETNIIGICSEIVNKLEDERLKMFMNEEISKHEDMKSSLMTLLEEKTNEWWVTTK